MSFEKALKTKKFTVTAEIFPPKGTDTAAALKKSEDLKDIVDAINVTDNQRAVMRMNPIVLCHQLVHKGIDAIYQMSCRDRNSMGLSSDILAASSLGIKNVLAVTGDYPLRNGKMLAKPVFELDSVQLLDLIGKLEKGSDLNGAKLESSPKFCRGAVVNPCSEQISMQILKLKKKVDAGASFIQTQVIFDIDSFKKFRDKSSAIKTKYLLGIFPLKSLSVAQFMAEKVPGVKVPEKVLVRMQNAKDPLQEGITIAVETIKELRSYCDGVHFMTMNDTDVVKKIMARI
ncbi:MAG: methylenetetrahydrofolate reductase [Candidatus Margulisiibacteriota bacterium]